MDLNGRPRSVLSARVNEVCHGTDPEPACHQAEGAKPSHCHEIQHF